MKMTVFFSHCLLFMLFSVYSYCEEVSGLDKQGIDITGYKLLNSEILTLQQQKYNQFIVLALSYDSTIFYKSLPISLCKFFIKKGTVGGYALIYHSKDTLYCKVISENACFRTQILRFNPDTVFNLKILKKNLFNKQEEGDRVYVLSEAYGYNSSGLYYVENKKTKYYFLNYKYKEPNSEFDKEELKRKEFLDYLHSIILKILPTLKFEKYHLIDFNE